MKELTIAMSTVVGRLGVGCVLWALLLPLAVSSMAEAVIPNCSLLGTHLSEHPTLWIGSNSAALPRQLAIDYNSEGKAYGMAVEYGKDSDKALFDLLRSRLQKEASIPPKIDANDMVVWRVEDRKLSISLTRDKESKEVRVLVVSIDKNVRSK